MEINKHRYQLIKPFTSDKVYETTDLKRGAKKCYEELKTKQEINDAREFAIMNIDTYEVFRFTIIKPQTGGEIPLVEEEHPADLHSESQLDRIERKLDQLLQKDIDNDSLQTGGRFHKLTALQKARFMFPPSKKLRESPSMLKIDDETMTYITDYKTSERIIQFIESHLDDIDLRYLTLVDATGGGGGDTINFAKRFKHVISIEKDPARYNFLVNNISVYDLKNVTTINGDSMAIIPKLDVFDVVYIDPPWGGKGYKDKINLRLKFGDFDLEDAILMIMNKELTLAPPKLVCLKLPRNYDLQYLYQRMKNEGFDDIYIDKLNKMNIVIIMNKNR